MTAAATARAQETADTAEELARNAMHAVTMHEAVCAERYRNINRGLDDLRLWLRWGLVALIGGLGTIAWALMQSRLGA